MMYFFNGNNSSFLCDGWDVNLSLGPFCKITILNRGCLASFLFSFFLQVYMFSPTLHVQRKIVGPSEGWKDEE